jgi:uncharacterized protein (TIGR03435 family)
MMRTVFVLVFVSAAIYGQPASPKRFEVAAVKPSDADPSSTSGIGTKRGRLNANNVTLKRCIMGAYHMGRNQIIGGPDWLDADRFEIVAKSDQPTDGDAELMAMLQTLMAERFKLALHRETRTMQAYAIEVIKNGPKLEKADGGEGITESGRGRLDARNTTMEHLAEILSRQMDLPVVNRTGLDGVFNLKLQWTPESARSSPDAGPSIFTAIQEQLGLRLRAQKAPLEVLVIDHAERPLAN